MSTGTTLSDTALALTIVVVKPGSNKLFKSVLDLTNIIVSTTVIETGVKLLLLRSLLLGTGISYMSSSILFYSNTL